MYVCMGALSFSSNHSEDKMERCDLNQEPIARKWNASTEA